MNNKILADIPFSFGVFAERYVFRKLWLVAYNLQRINSDLAAEKYHSIALGITAVSFALTPMSTRLQAHSLPPTLFATDRFEAECSFG